MNQIPSFDLLHRILTHLVHDHIERAETYVGAFLTDLAAFFIVVSMGATLFVHLDLLAEGTASSMQSLAEERHVLLTVHIDQPVILLGDEARLIQVIMNVLENALRFTHSGGRVSLSVNAGPNQVHLSVRDTGIGIAPEHLLHLFERFYRVDPVRQQTDGRSSTGLGLAIAEWIVRRHGGIIAVESQVGQGSCFTVALPLAPASQAKTARKEASHVWGCT